jgi:hypothetical protein
VREIKGSDRPPHNPARTSPASWPGR